MIEVVSAERCVRCDICLKVCPMDVFETGGDGLPVIARQQDCQTCFMCEAHCPADALFVAPFSGPAPPGSPYTDEAALAESGALGRYRDQIGWGRGRVPGSRLDKNHLFTARLAARPPDEPATPPR
ncbi:ferredoxin [Sphaerisporangium krabiense]|uniref:NAD-dependent dihydropyrimidine dehydrogenase PreA subunit n=1 Tax=Sphaerisporangium krabiense TaxID=763782 RepID=A0A7W8Z9C8_9ACTN|nr:ferredoxin family protein [Sphaerisporangium krabiense]MBB5629705.1 NAD-dependent dihydropyrimidine dehydrogenase PreA subunit [Sphaerisporangium krabiense]GII63805.1 ferredoxin [Sphaerisporangium krabiense]